MHSAPITTYFLYLCTHLRLSSAAEREAFVLALDSLGLRATAVHAGILESTLETLERRGCGDSGLTVVADRTQCTKNAAVWNDLRALGLIAISAP